MCLFRSFWPRHLLYCLYNFSMFQRSLTHPGNGFNDGQDHNFGNTPQNQLGVERQS
ncbi:hypothetical protein Golob_000576 [Gossypium lobatum]|uniref:Uncharacterized protein n=1 Tax=Gossypium lobatum TaxID=34289 RepID=A0A7J8N8Q8_9ROSI|nr:hypothetical protein [Gossypium lobatum]